MPVFDRTIKIAIGLLCTGILCIVLRAKYEIGSDALALVGAALGLLGALIMRSWSEKRLEASKKLDEQTLSPESDLDDQGFLTEPDFYASNPKWTRQIKIISGFTTFLGLVSFSACYFNVNTCSVLLTLSVSATVLGLGSFAHASSAKNSYDFGHAMATRKGFLRNYLLLAALQVLGGILASQQENQAFLSWESAPAIILFFGGIFAFILYPILVLGLPDPTKRNWSVSEKRLENITIGLLFPVFIGTNICYSFICENWLVPTLQFAIIILSLIGIGIITGYALYKNKTDFFSQMGELKSGMLIRSGMIAAGLAFIGFALLNHYFPNEATLKTQKMKLLDVKSDAKSYPKFTIDWEGDMQTYRCRNKACFQAQTGDTVLVKSITGGLGIPFLVAFLPKDALIQ